MPRTGVKCCIAWRPYLECISPITAGIQPINTLRLRQNGRHFADDIFKCIFFNENGFISINISLKFVSKVQINYIPALVQIMAWRRPGHKPLSEPMMVSLQTHTTRHSSSMNFNRWIEWPFGWFLLVPRNQTLVVSNKIIALSTQRSI